MDSEHTRSAWQNEDSQIVKKGVISRLLHWAVAPGNLGMHVGLLIGAGVVLCHYVFCATIWDPVLLLRLVVAPLIACVGGGIGGVCARDQFLRETWARFRPLVALLLGAASGGLIGLVLWDLVVGAAGALGGAVGAFTDAVIYRKRLEETW
jgi:hypothetical protein